MPVYHLQNVLNGGEISPLLRGRVDQPRYGTGTREMLNFVPMPQGGATRRPGTRFLGKALHEGGRLIPFVFSSTQGRMLEFGEKSMRVWLPDGSMVEQDGAIMEVSTPFAVADLPDVRFAQSADVIFFAHPDHPPCKLSRYADDDWRWETLTFLPSIAAPGKPELAAIGSPEGKTTTDYTYRVTAMDENGMESQASPEATIEAYALNSVDYRIRVSWTPVEGAAGYRVYKKKQGVFGFIGRVSPEDIGGITQVFAGVTLNGYPCRRVTDIEVDIKFTSGTVQISYVAITNGNASRFYWYCDELQILLAQYGYGGSRWILVKNVPPNNMVGAHRDVLRTTEKEEFGNNDTYPEGYLRGYTAAPVWTFTGGGIYFDDKNIGADTEDTPMEHKNPFTGKGNYPSQVFFHQQRLGFASTTSRPLTIWLSRTGEFESMASSVPPKDDDAIEVTLAATQANRIVWLRPDRNALAFGTEGSEWTLEASEGAVLTPSSVSFQLQTTNGGEGSVPALSMGGGGLYVQRGSGAVREFAYNYSADKYLGQDLTILARHVVRDRTIRAWTYQQEPFSVLWCVMSDGTLAGLTYMKEQEIIGWHRHQTDGKFLDAASIPGVPDDQVWFLVRRGSETLVERLETFFDSDDLGEAYFLDSALNYRGVAAQDFWGLDHLAGREVQVFADGGTIDGLTVSDAGELTLKNTATSVHVGIPYTSRIVPNLPEIQTEQGSSVMHNRKILSVRLRVYRSMSFLAGLDEERYPVADRQILGGSFRTRPFFSEGTDLELDVCGGWSDESPLALEVFSATPLTVLAVLTAMEVSAYSGKGGW